MELLKSRFPVLLTVDYYSLSTPEVRSRELLSGPFSEVIPSTNFLPAQEASDLVIMVNCQSPRRAAFSLKEKLGSFSPYWITLSSLGVRVWA